MRILGGLSTLLVEELDATDSGAGDAVADVRGGMEAGAVRVMGRRTMVADGIRRTSDESSRYRTLCHIPFPARAHGPTGFERA